MALVLLKDPQEHAKELILLLWWLWLHRVLNSLETMEKIAGRSSFLSTLLDQRVIAQISLMRSFDQTSCNQDDGKEESSNKKPLFSIQPMATSKWESPYSSSSNESSESLMALILQLIP